MSNPNTLSNTPLKGTERLENTLTEFFDGYQWDVNSEFIKKFKTNRKIKAVWHPDHTTASYFLKDYIKNVTKPLQGNEWIVRYPRHYVNLDKSHNKIIVQQAITERGEPVDGLWDDNHSVLMLETNERDDNNIGRLGTLIHEYGHSKTLGLEDTMDWINFKVEDWWQPEVINDDGSVNFEMIIRAIGAYATTRQLKEFGINTGWGYIIRGEKVIEENEAFFKGKHKFKDGSYKTLPAATQYGIQTNIIAEEIVVRAMGDIAVCSDAKHDDFMYLFNNENIHRVFTPKFVEKIKHFAWPRLPEKKTTLVEMFGGGSLWE